MAKHKSRATRFADAISKVTEAKDEIESLRDELQEWRDNIPENLQDGEKANELDYAIDQIETVLTDIDSVEGAEVEFPGMI